MNYYRTLEYRISVDSFLLRLSELVPRMGHAARLMRNKISIKQVNARSRTHSMVLVDGGMFAQKLVLERGLLATIHAGARTSAMSPSGVGSGRGRAARSQDAPVDPRLLLNEIGRAHD